MNADARTSDRSAMGRRMPVVYLPHGGGPWPFVDTGIGTRDELAQLAAYLRSVRHLTPGPPRAILVVSAHWEEARPTVTTHERPPLFFDYYGFPPESYTLTWPAPGSPTVATRVRELLAAGGFASGADGQRGFDHGAFVPLKLAYPDADVPTVQLSLKVGLDAAEHLAIGRSLAPLREEGVFVVGSGMTFENLRAFGRPEGRAAAETFDAWLRVAVTDEPVKRDEALTAWTTAPSAHLAHPRAEHLLPLMVVAGAAGSDRGTTAYSGTVLGMRISAYHFEAS
jgi:aromatic ring-opening dioxygenase catalytic subunit (LigB family)